MLQTRLIFLSLFYLLAAAAIAAGQGGPPDNPGRPAAGAPDAVGALRVKEVYRAFADNGVAVNGPLGVKGTTLVNAAGQPLQLRGMSSHGLAWFPQFINAAALLSIRGRGANVFRAAIYTDTANGGYRAGEESRLLNTHLATIAVENALVMDMYAIVDWHVLEEKNPLDTLEAAKEFFDAFAHNFRDRSGVIYEICNEPNGGTTWDDVHRYAMEVIPVIRRHAPDALILVGTPDFCTDLSGPAEKPLPFHNIMYTYHLYTGLNDHGYLDAIPAALAAGVPVFVSEWGLSSEESTGAINIGEGRAFISFMRDNGISWVNWSLSNKDEDFSAIRPEVTKVSNWDEADLTTSGRVIFAALGGE